MLADGIYRVQFETLVGSGTGIVVVSRDKIRGGDPAFAYFGTLQRTDNGFVADIETKRHAPGRSSVFQYGAGPYSAYGRHAWSKCNLHRHYKASPRPDLQGRLDLHLGLRPPPAQPNYIRGLGFWGGNFVPSILPNSSAYNSRTV
jgi:T3SS negative regulator,GrlR